MDNAPTLPLFRLGTIPNFPGGGPVFVVPTRAKGTWAGKALAACSNAYKGRLQLDAEAGTRWIARRGDLDHDHTPAVAFEGHPRKGETFHFFAWEDGSLAVAAVHGKDLLALPCVLQTPQPLHLGPLGNNWCMEWSEGGAAIGPYKRLSVRRTTKGPNGADTSSVFPEVDGQGPPARAAYVFRASLLQAMHDLAQRIDQQPPVLWPVTRVPRAGWTIPTFAASGAPKEADTGLSQLVHKALFPAVARALVAGHFAPNAQSLTARVGHVVPTGLGVVATPRLDFTYQGQVFACREAQRTFGQDAQNLFAEAWKDGRLGSVWPWISSDAPSIEVVFDPQSLSRHAVLAALAPKPPTKRHRPRVPTPPPPKDPPWWADIADDQQGNL